MNVYIDTSFLVSLYITDRNSSAAQQMLAAGPQLALTPLHRAEWVHAVEQHVFRRELSLREAHQIYAALEEDEAAGLWPSADLPPGVFERCAELARHHGARLGIRTLDSLHVATALELRSDEFWTFDERQRRLAAAEGLKVP